MKKILISFLVASLWSPVFASEAQKKEYENVLSQYSQTKTYNLPALKKLACAGYLDAQKTLAQTATQENNLYKYSFWLLEAAQRGDQNSQRSLSAAYDKGLGLGKNDKEGYKWFYIYSKDSSKSNEREKNHWGKKLSSKQMEEVEVLASKWKPLQDKEVKNCDVALQFHTDTQQRLVEIDKKKSVELSNGANTRNTKILDSLKDKNDVPSQIKKLSAYYESARNNKLSKEETNKFLSLLKELTDKKNPEALMVWGRMNMEGVATPKSIPQAITIYESLAQANYKPALMALEFMSNRNLLPAQNTANLVKKYESSTDESDKLRLARMYVVGLGVPKSTPKAIGIYEGLIKNGNKEAKKSLANLYLSNAISKKEPVKAVALLEELAKSGDEGVQLFLANYYVKNNDNQTNHVKALYWFKKLAEESAVFTDYEKLAQLYVDGKGVQKNNVEAYKWLYIMEYKLQNNSGRDLRKQLDAKMSKADIEKAKELASKWKRPVFKKV